MHCLPVTKWIGYKFFCLAYQCVYKTAPQYLQELVSQYNPPCSLRSSSLCKLSVSGFGENTNKKTFRSNVIPQCCTHPLEQAARQASPGKSHCFLSAAAEITFVFNFVIPSSPCPHPLPHVFLPLLSYLPPTPHPQSSLPSATSMRFSCMESDCAIQVDIDVGIDFKIYIFSFLKHRQEIICRIVPIIPACDQKATTTTTTTTLTR